MRREEEPPVADVAVNQAYDGLGATFDLLLGAFDRNSIDGVGAPLLATVHYGRDYDNAFWDGQRMVFGDGDGEIFAGFTGSVTVIGHELAHGVIQHTADLVYRGQSGALNESIADVIGALVEQRLNDQTATDASWLIGAGHPQPRFRPDRHRAGRTGVAARGDRLVSGAHRRPLVTGHLRRLRDGHGGRRRCGVR